MFWLRLTTSIVTVFFLGLGVFRAAGISAADWYFQRASLDSVKKATALDPANAEYHAALASLLESEGHAAERNLQLARSLSPFDSNYLSQLGFRAEVSQDYRAAEQLLLRAFASDRSFRSRWALANFYFRRNNQEKFWHWSRLALADPPADLTSLFRLFWAITKDSSMIYHNLPPVLPLRVEYLTFLNAEQVPEAGTVAATDIASRAESEDREVLDPVITHVSRILEKDPAAARTVWNILCRRSLMACQPLDPDAGPLVTGGHFQNPPIGKGFDWRIRDFSGVRTSALAGLTVRMDGSQPEIFDLADQPLPAARRRYRLYVQYEVTPETADSGLRWRVEDSAGRLIARTGPLRGPGLRTETVDFTSATNLLSLRLGFRRPPGVVRWNGTAIIREVSVNPAP